MKDLSLIISQIRQRLEILYQEVDKLEQSGGGGGGGTDDYNDLTNKPKINSVTLSGNKSLASLGIAAAATTYTKDETDGLLSNKADKSTTYTKTETGTEITNAINALDVASVGGAGSYIQAISEADGKISATSQTMDTTPTSESTKAITSGAVYTALSGKPALTDIFGMGTVLQPTEQAPADMNNITDIGAYTCSATYIDYLSNRPENKTGVNLYFEVRRLTTTRWMQTAYYQSNDADCFYIRWKTLNSWTSWYKFTDVNNSVWGTGTALTTGQDLNNITTLGQYNANTPTIAGSLSNCPVSTAFRMEVTTLNGSTRYVQVIYTVDTNTTLATIYVRGYTASGWSGWAKLMDNDTGVNSIVYGTSVSIDPAADTTIALADLAPGRYRITGSTAAGRVSDTPWTSSGFEIVVHNTSSSNYRVQTLYPALDANATDKYYQRHYRGTGTGAVNGWSPWYLYEGTVVS